MSESPTTEAPLTNECPMCGDLKPEGRSDRYCETCRSCIGVASVIMAKVNGRIP